MDLIPFYSPDYRNIVTGFLSEKLRLTGASGYVLGLSGGLDSAVTAVLAAEAVGSGRVLCIIMPHGDGDLGATEDAQLVARTFGLNAVTVDIGDIAGAVKSSLGNAPRPEACKRLGDESTGTEPIERNAYANVKSRSRAILLFYFANLHGYLVAGTSNKSELLVGYFTKFGDGASDIIPLGDLYKTQVYALAEELGMPQRIMKKPPTAGLIAGQTDEGELGLPYSQLDRILRGMELRRTEKEIASEVGVPEGEVERITGMVRRAAHKRQTAPIPKIGTRTPGIDWRENVDIGL